MSRVDHRPAKWRSIARCEQRKLSASRSRIPWTLLMFGAMIGSAGGIAIASNMAFRLVKPIVNGALLGPNDNWTSIPYQNSYGTFGGFCNKTGLKTTIGSNARITWINPVSNAPTSLLCGTSGADNQPLPVDGSGILIEQPASSGARTSIVIVGSHDPTLTVNILPYCSTTQSSPAYCANSPITGQGLFWFSVPYHTTAVTFRDLCVSADLSRTITMTASISRIDAATGVPESVTCYSAASTGIKLVLGEAVLIKEVAPKSFIPTHF